jgi:hypothetical protein
MTCNVAQPIMRAAMGALPSDDFFFAEQNGRLVKDAEEYYREMFRGVTVNDKIDVKPAS